MKLPSTRFLLPLLISLLLAIPHLSRASQAPEADTVSVLAITQYGLDRSKAEPIPWGKIKKVNYIAAGAVVNLWLKDGRTFQEVRIKKVGKEEVVIGEELVAISDIAQIEYRPPSRRDLRNPLGLLLILVGLILGVVGGFGLAILVYFSESLALLLLLAFPLSMVLGGIWLIFSKASRKFNFLKRKFSLGTATLKSLPADIQQKLTENPLPITSGWPSSSLSSFLTLLLQ